MVDGHQAVSFASPEGCLGAQHSMIAVVAGDPYQPSEGLGEQLPEATRGVGEVEEPIGVRVDLVTLGVPDDLVQLRGELVVAHAAR